MTHANRRKGDAFERAVVEFMRSHGFPYVSRAYGAGRPDDLGDLDGVPGVCISVKDVAVSRLSEWLDEAREQSGRGRKPLSVVIWKRRRQGIGRSYVVMELETFCELARES